MKDDENIEEEYSKYVSFFRSIINQALIDLKTQSKKPLAKTFRHKAMLWLKDNNKYFRTICYYADLNPDYIYEIVKKEMRNNKYFN
ncbi:MAG: hypothetical protein Ta2D_06510 [Rickettsiales bacterium]|nr:MAG: hypothetical protein Ta2D_06510 [Rickettsiales bacterium]